MGHHQHMVRLPELRLHRGGWQARQMRIKVVADCVEALTGAFFISGGEPAGFAFVSGPLDLLPVVPPLPPLDIQQEITSKSVRLAPPLAQCQAW